MRMTGRDERMIKCEERDLKIRPAREEDAQAAAQIEARCFPEAEAASAGEIKKRIRTFGRCFFVLEHRGEIIGFINGCVTDRRTICDEMFGDPAFHREEGAYQSIFGLDVLPEYEGQGLGSRLMRYMIRDAGRRGKRGLILTCKEHLIPFYETFGYVNMGKSQSSHGGAVWYDMILEL